MDTGKLGVELKNTFVSAAEAVFEVVHVLRYDTLGTHVRTNQKYDTINSIRCKHL